jgi:hypothetical protein
VTLVLQIVVAVLVLVGLITTIMSVKNWHWAQMLLLLGIFLSSLGVLLLGLEVFRIHRNLRRNIPKLEQQIVDIQADSEALRHGSEDPTRVAKLATELGDAATLAAQAESLADSMTAETFEKLKPITGAATLEEAQAMLRRWAGNLTSIAEIDAIKAQITKELEQMGESGKLPSSQYWARQLDDLYRQRGRVWRGVVPAGPIDPATGRFPVSIPQPKPHGLEKDALVVAFELGEPNAANPDQGAQFLGEFRAVEVRPDGAVLEPTVKLDQRTGNRIVRSQQGEGGRPRPWALYETMPADRHEIFAGRTEEELKRMLPAASVQEYLRHGTKATPDDDEYHRAAYDEAGNRVDLDSDAKIEERYDRQLRDYAYLFAEAARNRAVMLADQAALTEDIKKLKAAHEIAKKLSALRTQEKGALASDLENMKRDRQVIESLLATIKTQLENARQLVDDLLNTNVQMAAQLTEQQLGLLDVANQNAPAPQPALVRP